MQAELRLLFEKFVERLVIGQGPYEHKDEVDRRRHVMSAVLEPVLAELLDIEHGDQAFVIQLLLTRVTGRPIVRLVPLSADEELGEPIEIRKPKSRPVALTDEELLALGKDDLGEA